MADPITAIEVLNLALSAIVAAVYGWVALTIANRHVSSKARLANQGFASWWWSLVLLTVSGILFSVVGFIDDLSVASFMAYLNFVLLIISLAFTGLLYYFVFLVTGKQNAWAPIGLYYVVVFILFVYYIQLQEPTSVVNGELQYANDLSGTAFSNVITLAWLLPTIIGAGFYLSLLRQVTEPLQRFRIAVVATSIIVWFTISIGSSLGGVAEDVAWWTYVSQAISLTVAGLTIVAYRPPKKIRVWLGMEEPDKVAELPPLMPAVHDELAMGSNEEE